MPASQKLFDLWANMEQECQQILRKYRINSESMRAYGVRLPGQDTDSADLILVLTQDVEIHSWIHAATEIWQLFQEKGYEREGIKVEIRNERRAAFDKSVVMPNDERLLGMIAAIRNDVLEKVKTLFHEDWTFISYHMRSPIQDPSILKPTCIIGCKPGLRSLFTYIESEILQILDCPQFPEISLYFEICPGTIESSSGTGNAIAYVNMPPYSNRTSIGPRKNKVDAGTLGGCVLLRKGNSVKRCILSAYHVARSGVEGEALATNDKKGLGLDEFPIPEERRIDITSPALLDIWKTKSVLEKMGRDDDLAELWRRTQEMFGTVIFATGNVFRTPGEKGRRMDWVLIELSDPNNHFRNQPPPADIFRDQENTTFHNYYANSNDYITDFGEAAQKDWVVAQGRTTPACTGKWSKLLTDINWPHMEVSWEEQVLSDCVQGGPFATHGDSGSWIVNERYEVVGLLIAVTSGGSLAEDQ
ncbi:uncharacterized protein PAC_15103 [Phialocephala subalpina]|uniref:Uncharacterized protein n=1 Tax=Phialocephala subalpina TaxID=576137 RepID=A0A1L7XJK6_9HELO|nr:uncharacterized protein PAC_15103 [Phialocephala subalpina]